MRPSWVEVDLGAIAHNVAAVADLVAPSEVCVVVKADGYGHGDVPVAEAALEAGASMLAVALVEEGVRLREAGVGAPILLLSEPRPDEVGEVIEWRLIPTVYRVDFVEALAVPAGSTIPVHVKVDTGMHRVGAAPDQVPWVVDAVLAHPSLRLAALWTHFAVSEEDGTMTDMQLALFDDVSALLAERGVEPPMRHAANSGGALFHPSSRLSMVRLGIAAYGLSPAPGRELPVELRPAMRVVSHVSMVRRYPAATRLSYGLRRALPSDSNVATVPIGYADGYPRLLSARGGEVLIGGHRHPLAGTVTMDQIVVDCGDEMVAVGDEVVLLGRQGDAEIAAEEWAERLETINYEVVCQIGPRLPRRYTD
ncbi:MAG TPA: alanine racemase [Acidimicrobiia bacterium]|nr:alanine racemase [Acidimicrobiia bacterium]